MTRASLAADIGRPEQYVTVYSGMDVEPFLNPPTPREQVRRASAWSRSTSRSSPSPGCST